MFTISDRFGFIPANMPQTHHEAIDHAKATAVFLQREITLNKHNAQIKWIFSASGKCRIDQSRSQ